MSINEEQRKYSKEIQWTMLDDLDSRLSNPSLHGFTLTKQKYGISGKLTTDIARDKQLHEQVSLYYPYFILFSLISFVLSKCFKSCDIFSTIYQSMLLYILQMLHKQN